MLKNKIVLAGSSLLWPLLSVAHPGDHAHLGDAGTALHHLVLPLAALTVIAAALLIKRVRSRHAIDRSRD